MVAACLHAAKVLSLTPFAGCSLFMKRCSFFKPILLAVLESAAPSAHPAELEATNREAVSIDAVVARALTQNPELKFYEAEIAAARAGRKAAGLLANPELNGSVGQKTRRDAGLSSEG